MNTQEVIEQVLDAEDRRRRALMEDDEAQVAAIFAPDLVYIHTSGLIHNRDQYLAYARDVVRYLNVERESLQVRVYGDMAVMTGYQMNTLHKRGDDAVVRGEGFVTQVWVKSPPGWQIASFHGSRLPN